MTHHHYAGDLHPNEAWSLLASEPDAVLIDCRTDAEFAYVGLCDLSSLGKTPMTISWKCFPDMALNPAFVEDVAAAQPDPSAALLFLCRSGQRSRDAATALARAGYQRCYNVLGGFEGDANSQGHRGCVNGWKAEGLPWSQS